MTTRFRLLPLAFFALGLSFSTLGHAQQPPPDPLANTPAAKPAQAPAPASAPALPQTAANKALDTLREAVELWKAGKPDDAIAKINPVLQADPKNFDALLLRGSIYNEKKAWDKADADYNAALQIDPKSFTAKFNLNEDKFQQKQYDVARAGFLELVNDANFSDFVAYKVFLCDLFAGHDDVAAKELDVFNKAGSNPSYYFGNAASALYHKKTEDARDWLTSAVKIYGHNPAKVSLYTASLKDLGYLPLPQPPLGPQGQ